MLMLLLPLNETKIPELWLKSPSTAFTCQVKVKQWLKVSKSDDGVMAAENVCDVDKTVVDGWRSLNLPQLNGPLRASCHLGIGGKWDLKAPRALTVFPWGYIQASCACDKEVYYNKGTYCHPIIKETLNSTLRNQIKLLF